MNFVNYRKAPTLVLALLLAGALLLAACSGDAAAQVQAVVEAQTQSEPVESVEEGGEEAALVEANADAETESSTEGDNAADADESAELPQEAVVDEVRTIPVIVPGDPTLRGTDPATVKLASGQIQFLEFFAYWCPTCKRMAPTVHGLEDAYGDRIGFVYLDRDDPATASFREALGYVYQPHYFLLNPDGIVLASWIGYTDGAVLQDAIEKALQ